MKLIKLPAAKEDITEIFMYTYQNFGESQAYKYMEFIENAINFVGVNPYVGIVCNEIRKNYRKISVMSHRVFYYIENDTINISRILHEKMDYPRHF